VSTVAVVFATKHGHTRTIAARVAGICRAQGHDIRLTNLSAGEVPTLGSCDAAILISPIHVEKHEAKIVELAQRERASLDLIPNALLTISLTQTTAQDPSRSEADRTRARTALDRVVERFVAETGWHPKAVCRVAGRLAYREYGFFTRFLMRRISRKSGGSIDTSKNHEYTDWAALERFVQSFLDEAFASSPKSAPVLSRA
jgi:menaquinone-dependent protoporphyrinogen oxidase